jgi:hypothetical protein
MGEYQPEGASGAVLKGRTSVEIPFNPKELLESLEQRGKNTV